MSNDLTGLSLVLRDELDVFIGSVFRTISQHDEYKPNWHIEAMAYQLGRCLKGESKRLIITQPPRSLKSICTSIAFVAWALGHNPALRFICVSYSNELASSLARQFRAVVTSDWYRHLFPNVRIKKDTETELVTEQGGGRLATSVSGTLTGLGADIIIIDDPLKAEQAESVKARKDVNDWYASTLASRLNQKDKGAIILVMQRLHEDDLAGKLLAEGDWHHLDLPAIAVEDQKIAIAADDFHERKAGDVLHPERESRETLDRIKTEITSLVFSAQYQQRPVPIEGNVIKRVWFQIYEAVPERTPGAKIVQSWDIATTTSASNDYSVCTTWMMIKKDYYLIDVWRGRKDYPALKAMLIALAHKHLPDMLLIEEAGPGLPMLQELKHDTPPGVPRPKGIIPKGDKLVRLSASAMPIESGCVHLPKEAPWLDEFLHEMLAFPNLKHDDQVDSVSQFLNWAQTSKRREPLVPHPPEVIYGGERLFASGNNNWWDSGENI